MSVPRLGWDSPRTYSSPHLIRGWSHLSVTQKYLANGTIRAPSGVVDVMSTERVATTGVDLAATDVESLPPAEFIGVWLAATEAQEVFSPAAVQRMLFVLYGHLSEQPIAQVIGSWIALTVQRELFASQEVAELLHEIRNGLSTAELASSPA